MFLHKITDKSVLSTKIFTNEIGSVVKAFPRTVTNKLDKNNLYYHQSEVFYRTIWLTSFKDHLMIQGEINNRWYHTL